MRKLLDKEIKLTWCGDKIRIVDIFMVIMITVLAIVLRLCMREEASTDYFKYFKQWYIEVVCNGKIRSLGLEIGNYPPAYMFGFVFLTYLPGNLMMKLKCYSYIFEFFAAIMAASCIPEKSGTTKRILLFALILMSPTVIANGSLFVQCDMMYIAFVVFSVYGLLKQRYTLSFIGLGLAFAFKLQTVFILPLYILLWMEGKYKLRKFLWIPGIYCAFAAIPVMMGRSFKNILDIYIGQVGQFTSSLTMNYFNIYTLTGNKFVEEFTTAGIFFYIMIMCCVYYYIYSKKIQYSEETIVKIALFTCLIAIYFLPLMHERYGIVTDVLSIILVFFDRKKFYIPIVINLTSFLMYEPFLMGYTIISPTTIAIALFVCIVFLGRDLLVLVNGKLSIGVNEE